MDGQSIVMVLDVVGSVGTNVIQENLNRRQEERGQKLLVGSDFGGRDNQ